MTRIGVRELRQHASRYLDLVKAGETVEVTERGELVALLVSPTRAEAARDRLVATGRLVPASGPLRLPLRRGLPAAEESASETLAGLRDDRIR
ncbi:MAG: type II toxin-antitoxin system Phd/YefM family antitoxin [Acidimicrobiales bacterium]